MPFICSICEEESTHICVACTKDSCGNHLCERCRCCSDCCGCEVRLDATEIHHPETHEAPENSETMLATEPRVERAGMPAEELPGEIANKNPAG